MNKVGSMTRATTEVAVFEKKRKPLTAGAPCNPILFESRLLLFFL